MPDASGGAHRHGGCITLGAKNRLAAKRPPVPEFRALIRDRAACRQCDCYTTPLRGLIEKERIYALISMRCGAFAGRPELPSQTGEKVMFVRRHLEPPDCLAPAA
jgi:hypothetical protein